MKLGHDDIRYYILTPVYAFRGWKLLPYAIQSQWKRKGYITRVAPGQRELLPIQQYRFYPARFKESVQWSVTGLCNYKCSNCALVCCTPADAVQVIVRADVVL